MSLYLGIDGGQSSTTCLIGDETGAVVGVGRAGPCNHVGKAPGRERFVSAISGSMRAALEHAGLPASSRFAVACFGLSGGPDDKAGLARELVPAGLYEVTHDAAIALSGAAAGGPGIIVISGTGSIAYGRNAAGRTVRAGGWGYIFGDEGSAFDIVRQAVRAILRYEEGWGPPSNLRDLLLPECGVESANALLHLFYTDDFPRDRVAGLANLVDEAAAAGDPVAQEILRTSAQALATIAAAVRRQLFKPGEPVAVHPVGGAFGSDMLREYFQFLVEMEEQCQVLPAQHEPAVGALLDAYRLAGIACTLRNIPEGL